MAESGQFRVSSVSVEDRIPFEAMSLSMAKVFYWAHPAFCQLELEVKRQEREAY
jgi:hypothetical protein